MEDRKYCYRYPHPAVTTDCVVFGFDGEGLSVLLIERGGEPYKGRWAFPGGFLNIDEHAEHGALRELREETGLAGIKVRQLHTFSDPERDSRERVISIAYYALTRLAAVRGGDDAARARWFPLSEIPHPLAFDHERLLSAGIEALRLLLLTSQIADEALPEEFTKEELSTIYKSLRAYKRLKG